MNRPARDQWLRAVQSISLNITEGNGKQSLKDKNRFFEIARGSALECASIHDVLVFCDAIDVESNRRGKSDLKRIVSMLTRLIQRTETVSEDRIEYEYRDAEYEYERMPEQRNPPEPAGRVKLDGKSHPAAAVISGVIGSMNSRTMLDGDIPTIDPTYFVTLITEYSNSEWRTFSGIAYRNGLTTLRSKLTIYTICRTTCTRPTCLCMLTITVRRVHFTSNALHHFESSRLRA